MVDGEGDESPSTRPPVVGYDDIKNGSNVDAGDDVDDEFDYDEQLIQKIYTSTTNTTTPNAQQAVEQNVTSDTSENMVTLTISPQTHNVQETSKNTEAASRDSPVAVEDFAAIMGDSPTTIGVIDSKVVVGDADEEEHEVESSNIHVQENSHIDTIGTIKETSNGNTADDTAENCNKTVKYEAKTEVGDSEREEYEKVSSEWDDLEEIEPQEQGNIASSSTEKLMFQEALEHFDSVDMKAYESKINPTVKRSRMASAFQSVIGQKLHKSLVAERNLIFTLAMIQFENTDQIHLRILLTIFKTLTRRKIDCARFGSHWELIGFQGNDPATDLRGCGMLSLLMILRLITSPKTRALSSSVYQLSRDEIQNFPFSVMSINLTRISLQILREGKLNKECNQRRKNKLQKYRNEFDNVVFDVLQDLYVAIFNKIYTIWKNEGKTMAESGFVVRDVEDYAKSKPVVLLKQFYKAQNSSKDNNKSSHTEANDDKIESFVGVDEL